MKKLMLTLMFAAAAMSVMVSAAEAKRLGGGGSFGRQSQGVSRQATPAQAPNAARPAAPAAVPAAVPPKPASPWRGILGGALLGLGLGALLSHLGLGGAMASMISTILMVALLGVAALFIYRMFRRKTDNDSQPRTAFSGAGNATPEPFSRTPEIGANLGGVSLQKPVALETATQAGATILAPWGVPDDFDVQGFLRTAKTYFIRLQAAWDKADIKDLREFTTTEMFAEFKLELQERGTTPNSTDVVSLDADLMGIETVGDDYVASVKFSGMIKESESAPAAPFAEVWNLSKPTSGQGGWMLAGI